MNLGELTTKIEAFVKDPDAAYFTEITTWINDASFEATKDVRYPWKWKEQTTTIDEPDYDPPSDFIKLADFLPGYFNSEKIDHRSISWLDAKRTGWRSASSGTPECFYKEKVDKISLYAPPSTAATFLYPYVYKETAMAANSSTNLIATNHPNLIIFKVVAQCKTKEKDDETEIIKWMNWYQGEVLKVRGEIFQEIIGSGETTLIE